ncbi:Gfo/Idh/MocA family protein [Cryptosporangium aurantiacum]|uniref:Predicted dehydrogenase n=1 Tax=Cryptosporangium aurantiacum TaxID=134849 RepID=A0A1M7RNX8_9ACTN|nr:Gfo/Idh/MocA family oxidoreductase [Cryptosporangium aurantiacum]SHN48035.1 Predicted dehydrogenase [Cryptosporangium aurantiacum]
MSQQEVRVAGSVRAATAARVTEGGQVAVTRCRIGLVGAGRAAARHASTLARFHDVSIVGVTDCDLAAAARLAADCDATVAPTVGALLALRPDAVFVCVPPFAHGPIEEELLDAGLPIFVETPLGVDREVPDLLARRVASAGVVTAVGHHWRYSAAVRRAGAVLAGRPIRLVTGSWLDSVDTAGWWGRRDRSGGPIVEQVVHLLDLLRALAGEVVEVYAAGDGTPPPGVADADIDGVTAATLRFASGAVATLATTCRFTGRRRAGLEIFADGASVTITEDGCEIRVGDRSEWHAVDAETSYRAADRAFVDAIRRPEARVGVLADYAQAVRTHRLACALTRSAAEGRALRLRTD